MATFKKITDERKGKKYSSGDLKNMMKEKEKENNDDFLIKCLMKPKIVATIKKKTDERKGKKESTGDLKKITDERKRKKASNGDLRKMMKEK